MTELIWDGKYDSNGKKTAPVRIPLPFQDIETVNESAQERNLQFDLWSSGQSREWRNRLVWGDKRYVLPSLLPEFAGKVNLIYIDPPFNTGSDFSFTATIPDDPNMPGNNGATFVKEPSMIEQKAYRDTWGRGLDGYLQWFYETVVLLHELLAETGSLYVHLDYNVGHYIKCVLDDVFGVDNFRSEIVWKRTHSHGSAHRFGPIHDVIFFYSKSSTYTWTQLLGNHDTSYVADHFTQVDLQTGRKFQPISLTGAGVTKGDSGKPWRGIDPTKVGRHWALPEKILSRSGIIKGTIQENLDALDQAGRIYWPKKQDGTPRLKWYADELEGAPLADIWTDLSPVGAQALERTNYATQKPEALLERIIKASSNEGDLVLDCFCGSGTTAAVAEKLNRRWITCDLGRFAIHTTRKRLLGIANVKPFVVQNLGKYERQAWQTAEFGPHPGASAPPFPRPAGEGLNNSPPMRSGGGVGGGGLARAIAAQERYRRFILDLYHAQPIAGYQWLHGVKNGHFVHVGSVDAPVLRGDLTAIAREFWQASGRGDGAEVNSVDILGWDFAFELNEVGRQTLIDAGIKPVFRRIPREVLERKAVEQGDIRFFELAALDVEVKAPAPVFDHPSPVATGEGTAARAAGVGTGGQTITITLRDFVVHPDDVPQDVQQAITHWSQWIDYWAVDFNFQGDTFHNEWQAYRTKKSPQLQTSVAHRYEQPGTYTVVVKVIDILGNDTTKSLTVEVQPGC